MNQTNQENSSDASLLLLPIRRKRGRPRKDRTLHRLEGAPVPPGFKVMDGTLPSHVDPVKYANDSIIGRTVTGVVEAIFDAGYLLAVKIGNSNTTLKGVVFKPGHYVPVTAENDVAPHVQMIRRNGTYLSSENKTHVRGHKPRQRSRGGDMQLVSYTGNGSIPSLKGNYVPAPFVPLVGARGTVVPVVLQPVNLAHQVTLNGKNVQTVLPLAVCPPNESTSQELHRQPQISSQEKAGGLQAVEAKPIASSGDHLKNGDEGQGEELNEPLFVEPLQTRHNLHSQSAPFVMPVQNNGTGRMSELLQAMQDKLIQSQISLAENHTQGFTGDFHRPKSIETQEQTHTQAEGN